MTVVLAEPGGMSHPVRVPDWIDVAPPAAGANKTVTLPPAYAVRVLAAKCQLDTDANAANRYLSLDYIKADGTTYVENGAGLVITASTVAQVFDWQVNRSVGEWATNTPVFVPLLPLWLPPGIAVRFTVDNIQTGDTLTNIKLVVEYAAAVT